MPWTERQHRMLAEFGLPAWFGPPSPLQTPPGAEAAAEATVAAAAPGPAAEGVAPRDTVVPAAPAGEIAGLDWIRLRSTVDTCTACRLCERRTQAVFGVGNPQAHWMFVGEPPGEEEDRCGEPFVGRAGALLDNMLRALRLTRAEAAPSEQVFITHALKCRPPDQRNPTEEETLTCEPYLRRQIELVRPRVIVAMGRFANLALLRSSEPIGRLRGRVHHVHGVPTVVTFHPSYLLRNPQDKARAWDDLCLAAEVAAGGLQPVSRA